MDELIALLGAFPTVVFAAMSALCVAYWCLVLLGAADIDALDGVTGKAEGAVKGVIHGALEGAGDAVAGGLKGGTSALADALASLGLSRVPLTITLSMFSLAAFLASVVTHHLLAPLLPAVVTSLAATAAALVVGGGAAAGTGRALAGVFDDGAAATQGGVGLIGKTCRITIDADDAGGQARIDEIIVPVRVIGGRIARDEEAIILDRADDGVFVVEPLKALMPTQQDAFDRLQRDADVEAARAVSSSVSVHKS